MKIKKPIKTSGKNAHLIVFHNPEKKLVVGEGEISVYPPSVVEGFSVISTPEGIAEAGKAAPK